MSIDGWMTGRIIKLLEITHGQLLYFYVMVHDCKTGTLIKKKKEKFNWKLKDSRIWEVRDCLRKIIF